MKTKSGCIVAYATYNRNESKDALICGVFFLIFQAALTAAAVLAP